MKMKLVIYLKHGNGHIYLTQRKIEEVCNFLKSFKTFKYTKIVGVLKRSY